MQPLGMRKLAIWIICTPPEIIDLTLCQVFEALGYQTSMKECYFVQRWAHIMGCSGGLQS